MGNLELVSDAVSALQETAGTLICVNPTTHGFLRSQARPPINPLFEAFSSAEDIFNLLWSGSREIETIILDDCEFDLEELLFASFNHEDVLFIVRSPRTIDENWRRRLLLQSNVALPRTDLMVWVYAHSKDTSNLQACIG